MYIHIAIHVLLDVHPSFGGCGNRRDSPFRPLLSTTIRVNLFCKMHDAHICLFNIIGINEWVLACLRGTVYSMIKSETCVAWYDVQAMVIYIMMLKNEIYKFMFSCSCWRMTTSSQLFSLSGVCACCFFCLQLPLMRWVAFQPIGIGGRPSSCAQPRSTLRFSPRCRRSGCSWWCLWQNEKSTILLVCLFF